LLRSEELAQRLARAVIEGYRAIAEVLGVELPGKVLEDALIEASHIAIHEMVHRAIDHAYPRARELWKTEPDVAVCIEEIGGRFFETLISERIGAPIHSLEDHLFEIKHYSELRDLELGVEDLKQLYDEARRVLEERGFVEALRKVESECRRILQKKRR